MIEEIMAFLIFFMIVIAFFPFDYLFYKRNFKKLLDVLKQKKLLREIDDSFRFKQLFHLGENLCKFLRIRLSLKLKKRIREKIILSNLGGKISIEGFIGVKCISATAAFAFFLLLYILSDNVALLIIIFTGTVFAYICPDTFIDIYIKKRQSTMEIELPNILNTLAVITDAGLNFNEAIAKLCEVRKGVLVDELKKYHDEINIGFLQQDALMRLVDRCRVPEISVFASTLIQSMEKGSSGVTRILKEQAKEIWENRLNRARELGEQASMKLFLPMLFLVFPCLLVFIIGPALFTIISSFI